MNADTIQEGAQLVYNDGRKAHSGIKAVVVAVYSNGAWAQFEDRAEPTFMPFNRPEWWDHITIQS